MKRSRNGVAVNGPLPKKMKTGRLLTMGSNEMQQLGLGEDYINIDNVPNPRAIKQPPGILEAKSLACGAFHSLAINSEGKVFSWGCNDDGQLGRRTESEEENCQPGEVHFPYATGLSATAVSVGDRHSAALITGGRLFIWGVFQSPSEGRVGLCQDHVTSSSPVEIAKDWEIVDISSGYNHLLMLTSDGKILTIGCAEMGVLGRIPAEKMNLGDNPESTRDFLTPAQVKANFGKPGFKPTFTAAWAGANSCFGQSKSGDIYAWGLNNCSQLAKEIGSSSATITYPEKISNLSRKAWKKIVPSSRHTVALDRSGRVYAFGNSHYGKLGTGKDKPIRRRHNAPSNNDSKSNYDPDLCSRPVRVADLPSCVDVSAGGYCSFAVAYDGSVYSWGAGHTMLGQTADPDEDIDDLWTPAQICDKKLKDRSVLRVAAGSQHAAIILDPTRVSDQ